MGSQFGKIKILDTETQYQNNGLLDDKLCIT